MKFTVLVENTAIEPLQCEHGLSILIEYRNESFLLDAGTTDLFLKNAELLGISLQNVRNCFLSHGHYDHSGGFSTYLDENREAVLYMMKSAEGEYCSLSGEFHTIGIPEEVIEKHKSRFEWIDDVSKVKEGIYLIPHHTEGLETIGERVKLYKKSEDGWVPDDFSHEMSLVFDTEKGLVIFNSCSHGGVLNIIREVMDEMPDKKIYAFIGGLHMKGDLYSDKEIKETADELEQTGLQVLYTGHCTGDAAMKILKENLDSKVQELYTGLTVEI